MDFLRPLDAVREKYKKGIFDSVSYFSSAGDPEKVTK
jgi:hypothetical protein